MTSRVVVRRRPEAESRHRMSVVVLCCCLAIVVGAEDEGPGEDGDCSAVQEEYGSKGFSGHEVPLRMIADLQLIEVHPLGALHSPRPQWNFSRCKRKVHGSRIPVDEAEYTGSWSHLVICQLEYTCCTQEMEENLNLRSNHDINQLIMDRLDSYRQTFVMRLLKFDDYFVELIDQSRISLHNMFLRTYGQLYEQNVQIFLDLFHGLRSFYKKTSAVDVQDVLDRFFAELMRRIFCLMNSNRQFDDTFFVCIGEHMDQLRPFGDIPLKLHLQVKRSLTAARVFVDGLGAGRDVILAMSKFEHGEDCFHELMKLTYCSYCGGFADIRPCANNCLVVFRRCFSHFAQINRLWNSYLAEMAILATRLDGAFNVEMVVTPLGVKLSEAIMLFQENSDSFSSKVFQGCGEPKLHHHQHHSNDSQNETAIKGDLSTESLDFDTVTTANPVLQSFNHSTFGSGKANLNRLIRDAQGKLQAMRDSWKNLPELLCNETSLVDSDNLPNCWNGSASLRKYSNERVDEFNEDALSSLARHGNFLEKELYQLRVIISKIKSAHNGISEELIDDEPSGSGDESGSGINDSDQLKTSRDIYIDRVSSPQESTTDLINVDFASSTGQPRIVNAASCIHTGLQSGPAWPMAVLIVIQRLLLRLLRF